MSRNCTSADGGDSRNTSKASRAAAFTRWKTCVSSGCKMPVIFRGMKTMPMFARPQACATWGVRCVGQPSRDKRKVHEAINGSRCRRSSAIIPVMSRLVHQALARRRTYTRVSVSDCWKNFASVIRHVCRLAKIHNGRRRCTSGASARKTKHDVEARCCRRDTGAP